MIKRIERADGARFQVYAQRGGRKVYVGTYDSKRAASDAEEDFRVTQRKIDAGELPPELDTTRTLRDGIDAWLKSLEASRARSHRAYSEFTRYQILPRIGDAVIARLTKAHVMRWRDELRETFAATTANSALGCLSSAMGYFVDRGWIAVNPCRGVKQLEQLDRSYNWIKTRGEVERLLLHSPDELRDIIAAAIGTGMRIDELLHLQWVDIDLEARLITVQRGRQGTVKGGRLRHVPILDSVLPMLRQRALRRAGATLVFPGKDGAVRAKTPVQCAYKFALKRAGLDTSLRFHDLRHTMASWWVVGGGDIFRLSRILGHSSVQITQRTYAHLAPEAWQQDYHRLAFHVPTAAAKLYEFKRDDGGKVIGRRLSSREMSPDASELRAG